MALPRLSMAPSHLALGTVFTLDQLPYELRVVAFDQAEVMYDMRWSQEVPWMMGKLTGMFAYFRLPRDHFEAEARYLRMDPLSARELEVHRPELPFAVAQCAELSWYEGWGDIGEFAASHDAVLPVGAIFLSPFGPRDTGKPAVLLHADNGDFFTALELLRKAKVVQDPHIGNVRLNEGVGIYREGIKKRIPSYYIWGARSRADAPAISLAHAATRVVR
jgi:hypothetical protein